MLIVENNGDANNGDNDGRKKTFYCLAVNLLDLKDLQIVMEQIDEVILESDSLKIKAVNASRYNLYMC